MATPFVFDLILPNETATREFATALSGRLRPGDVVLLSGHIGAGKTAMARAIIQARLDAAGLFEDVPSPTYTLVQTYWDGICEIVHADLYRLEGGGDVVELGLEEAFETAICLVEWPDRFPDAWPDSALMLALEQTTHDTERRLRVSGDGEIWNHRVEDLFRKEACADSDS